MCCSFFFFSSRRRHTRCSRDWSSDVCSSDLEADHVVYLPRVSHHTLAFATLGLKLGVGWLREDSRLELHRDADSFAEKFAQRSEERRVGKECRSRWSPYH